MNSAAPAFAWKYGPWALVTGASEGIGRAFATELARRRVHLVLVARASLDVLGRGGTVRPGLLAQLLGCSLGFAPRWGRVKIMGKVMAGMASRS